MGTQRTRDLTIVDSITLGANGNSPSIDVSQYARFSIQTVFTYSGGDNSTGTVKLQASNDNFNFSDVPDSTLNFTSTTGNNLQNVVEFSFPYVRVAVTNTTGSGGTAKITIHAVYITD